MTKQEIFDKVSTHLLTQGERSTITGGFCAYKGLNGLQCAIGCLIPSEVYDKIIEKKNASDRVVKEYLAKAGVQRCSKFLTALQYVHDRTFPSDWKVCLAEIAVNYNLNGKVLNQF